MGESVLCSLFSPCGSYLLCASSFGWIHTWKLEHTGPSPLPRLTSSFRAHAAALYALVFVNRGGKQLVFSGSEEEIRCWDFEHILAASNGKIRPLITLHTPRQEQRRGALGQLTDTAAFSFDPVSGLLFSAAGDGNAYGWDLVKFTATATLQGEGEPLYCVATRPHHSQASLEAMASGCTRVEEGYEEGGWARGGRKEL